MDTTNELLLIFIKNPQKGNVKTRLARTIGNTQALNVYRALLAHTHKITRSMNRARQVWYSRFIDHSDRWEQGNFAKRLQSGDDLGERMKGAFKQAFEDQYEKVIIIGSDCADLSRNIIDQAFAALDDNEVVLGPSKDGGYYLLGMRRFYGDLFAGINWSTPAVLSETIGRVESCDCSYQLMPTLNDIDTEEDLRESGAKLDYL
jgi:rSAM/selenodomain-associated transferase 1